MFFQEAVAQGDGVPGPVIAIQTFGDFLGFHPHCHVLCTDGCFDGKALFRVAPRFNPEDLKAISSINPRMPKGRRSLMRWSGWQP